MGSSCSKQHATAMGSSYTKVSPGESDLFPVVPPIALTCVIPHTPAHFADTRFDWDVTNKFRNESRFNGKTYVAYMTDEHGWHMWMGEKPQQDNMYLWKAR